MDAGSYRIKELRRLNEIACEFFSIKHSQDVLPIIFQRVEEIRMGLGEWSFDMNITEQGETFLVAINEDNGEKYIQCKRCERKSYHPRDISEKYCANCKRFHDCIVGDMNGEQ